MPSELCSTCSKLNTKKRSDSSHGYHDTGGVGNKVKVLKRFKTEDIRRLIVKKWALLEEVAEVLETITIATGNSLFVVEEKSNSLHLWINGRASSYCYDIQPGTILAAYSAYTKKLQVAALHFCANCPISPNYPLGIGKNAAVHVLSLPVVTPNEKVLAVIELYRDLRGGQFYEEDQLIGLTIANWVAAAYEKHFRSQKLLKENNLHQTMFKILADFFKVNRDIDKLIECIGMFIKNKMDISSFVFYRFVMNRQHWAYVYKEENPNKLTRSDKAVRIHRSYGFVSIVLKEHKNLNLNMNDLDKKYTPYLRTLQSKAIDSILLVPIIRSGFVMGVMELVHISNGKQFTAHDEELFKNVSKYYSLALHYTNLLSEHKQIKEQLEDEKKLLFFMLEPCEHDFKKVLNKWCYTKSQDIPEKFMSFSYYPWQAQELELIEQALILLNHAAKDVFENDENMIRFTMISKKMYRNNFYHNFEHAFNVMHFIVNIKEAVKPVLSELEWKAMVIAAFCHDMDHPGFTNNFLKATSHYLVELYQESVLENHHSYIAHLLIQQLNLFSKFSRRDYKFVLNEIHEIIIATDLSVYFQRSQVITSIITSNSFSWFNPKHIKYLKSLMITTSDLSGQWKPCEVVVKLTMGLYEEFYFQGDKEKAIGLKPISMMDRNLKNVIPTDQLNFLILICIPCADILVSILPQLFPILTHIMEVLEYWLKEKNKLGFRSEEEKTEEEARLIRVQDRITSRFKLKIDK